MNKVPPFPKSNQLVPTERLNQKRSRFVIFFISLGLCFFLTHCASEKPVKKSRNHICHDKSSPFYDQVKNFKPYRTLNACLNSGGRLPKIDGQPTSHSTNKQPKYERHKFGHGWLDFDKDCMNTRHEVLLELSTSTNTMLDKKGCYVQRGKWYDPYTGRTFYNAKEVDIDHIVPLKYAWDLGASKWSSDKRKQFANDPMNLIPVDRDTNRKKSAQGMHQWLPPNKAYHKQYILRFTRICKKYKLDCHDARR